MFDKSKCVKKNHCYAVFWKWLYVVLSMTCVNRKYLYPNQKLYEMHFFPWKLDLEPFQKAWTVYIALPGVNERIEAEQK